MNIITGKLVRITNLVFVMVFSCLLGTTAAQEDPLRVYMYLDYYKIDDMKYLEAELKYREEGGFKQLGDVSVAFRMTADTSTGELGKVQTNSEGIARLDLTQIPLLSDTSGVTEFYSVFSGNASYKSAKKSISISDLIITMEADIVDSIKQLTISAARIKNGAPVKVDDLDLKIMTMRLYGLLPIAEVTTDKNGMVEFEFPNDLPGDALGNLRIIAMTDDDDDFGTIKAEKKLSWGIPVFYNTEKPRALWSRDAPVWIIATVITLFAVVWYHYFLAVTQLFKIRKL